MRKTSKCFIQWKDDENGEPISNYMKVGFKVTIL